MVCPTSTSISVLSRATFTTCPSAAAKRLASGVGRAADEAIGGWQLSGITTFQAGFPFDITANDIDGLNNTPAERANIVAGCDPHANLTERFQRINMSCYHTAPGRNLWHRR